MTVASTENVQRRSIELAAAPDDASRERRISICAGAPPLIRLHGRLQPMDGDPLRASDIGTMMDAILQPHQKAKLEKNLSVDLGYGVHGLGRFRCNIYLQRGTLAASFRLIPYKIKAVEDLELPRVAARLLRPARWAWCWSPAPPAAASRPRWRR